MTYIWIAIGEVSGLPVFASDKKYSTHWWLSRRRSTDHVRLFRSGGPRGIIEACVRCFLEDPDRPVREKNHDR